MKKYMFWMMMILILVGCISNVDVPEVQTELDDIKATADEENLSAVVHYLNGLDGYPKIFQAWNPAENLSAYSFVEQLALHDLIFHGPYPMNLRWNTSDEQPYEMLATTLVDMDSGEPDLSNAVALKEEILKLNPDFIMLCELNVRETNYVNPEGLSNHTPYWERGSLPPDSDLWLRDRFGSVIPSWGEDSDADGTVENHEATACLMDFTNPDVQNLIVQKAIALKESGVFDGIFMDWWSETHHTLVNLNYSEHYVSLDMEVAARVELLQKIRAAVGDDFLILVNTNFDTVPKSAPYINGIYMECYKDWDSDGYEEDQMARILETLMWAESQLQSPTINCLEGWRNTIQYNGDETIRHQERQSADNLRWMRAFTTLSLTCSDGYVLYGDANDMPTPDHLHDYYAFWTIDLGRPTSEKSVVFQAHEDVYIRFFEHGLVVYNGSGSPVTLDLNGIWDGEERQVNLEAYDGNVLLNTYE